MSGWRFDPAFVASAALALATYAVGVRRYRMVRGRAWPRARSFRFAFGIAAALVAVESPLDAAGDARFAPHMLQHLILTDVCAPFVLLGAPLLLVLAAAPTRVARRVVALLKSRLGRALAFPPLAWSVFIVSLWLLHYTGFFETALEHEPAHVVEHALYLSTALLFWFPVVAIGPAPWAQGPLAYPLRMLYLLAAMPAEGMLGFAINGSRRVLYPHYAAAGLGDQQTAGELMWIGGSFAMFVAFMLVGYEWAQHEQRLGLRLDARSAALVNEDRVR